MAKKIDKAAAPVTSGSRYPAPYDQPCRARSRSHLGDVAGLDQFGVNLCRLPPGAWSSQRHWHTDEDEFVYIVKGEVVLVTDAGEEILNEGDCAGFKAGVEDGHHFQNRSGTEVLMLEVGTRHEDDAAYYPDIDLRAVGPKYLHRDGTPYQDEPRPT